MAGVDRLTSVESPVKVQGGFGNPPCPPDIGGESGMNKTLTVDQYGNAVLLDDQYELYFRDLRAGQDDEDSATLRLEVDCGGGAESGESFAEHKFTNIQFNSEGNVILCHSSTSIGVVTIPASHSGPDGVLAPPSSSSGDNSTSEGVIVNVNAENPEEVLYTVKLSKSSTSQTQSQTQVESTARHLKNLRSADAVIGLGAKFKVGDQVVYTKNSNSNRMNNKKSDVKCPFSQLAEEYLRDGRFCVRKVSFHPFSPFHAVILLSNNVLLLTDVLTGNSEEFALQNSLQRQARVVDHYQQGQGSGLQGKGQQYNAPGPSIKRDWFVSYCFGGEQVSD